MPLTASSDLDRRIHGAWRSNNWTEFKARACSASQRCEGNLGSSDGRQVGRATLREDSASDRGRYLGRGPQRTWLCSVRDVRPWIPRNCGGARRTGAVNRPAPWRLPFNPDQSPPGSKKHDGDLRRLQCKSGLRPYPPGYSRLIGKSSRNPRARGRLGMALRRPAESRSSNRTAGGPVTRPAGVGAWRISQQQKRCPLRKCQRVFYDSANCLKRRRRTTNGFCNFFRSQNESCRIADSRHTIDFLRCRHLGIRRWLCPLSTMRSQSNLTIRIDNQMMCTSCPPRSDRSSSRCGGTRTPI